MKNIQTRTLRLLTVATTAALLSVAATGTAHAFEKASDTELSNRQGSQNQHVQKWYSGTCVPADPNCLPQTTCDRVGGTPTMDTPTGYAPSVCTGKADVPEDEAGCRSNTGSSYMYTRRKYRTITADGVCTGKTRQFGLCKRWNCT